MNYAVGVTCQQGVAYSMVPCVCMAIPKHVIELTGSRSTRVFRSLPADNPMQHKSDISLAQQKREWATKVALKAELRRTIAYSNEILSGSQ